MQVSLGGYADAVAVAQAKLEAENIVERIWQIDHTVWREDPTEIANRLGWLTIADELIQRVTIINALADSLQAARYTDVVVLGMGGSSLAPDMFGKLFGSDKSLKVSVLDSTDPGAVQAVQDTLHPEDVCFIVATKSGGTAETLSFFKHFYNWTVAGVGVEKAGEHFVAITDPGSKLVTLAEEYNFRHTYLNNPNIGGRYSALSFFGLVPAAAAGVNVTKLLERAIGVKKSDIGPAIGVMMGVLAQAGRDKLTLTGSAELLPFGDWVEQLIAESTGKDGVGILPVVGEPLGSPADYGDDRVFVSLELADTEVDTAALDALAAAGHPVIRLSLSDLYDLGAQFFIWEVATAISGHILNIQPFDQPNVEEAKISARAAIEAYETTGKLPESETGELSAESVNTFISQAKAGDYVAIMAYVKPTEETTAALEALREKIWRATKCATTLGYGPRFLHSTGQLHKGDGGNGLFIQITSSDSADLPIPDKAGGDASAMSFNTLKLAQAIGDAQALIDADRRLLRLHIEDDVAGSIQGLI